MFSSEVVWRPNEILPLFLFATSGNKCSHPSSTSRSAGLQFLLSCCCPSRALYIATRLQKWVLKGWASLDFADGPVTRVRIHVSVFVTSQEKKNPASPLSLQVVTFHRLWCRYLRRAFFTAKPKHRFGTGVAREAACFQIGATSVFP